MVGDVFGDWGGVYVRICGDEVGGVCVLMASGVGSGIG